MSAKPFLRKPTSSSSYIPLGDIEQDIESPLETRELPELYTFNRISFLVLAVTLLLYLLVDTPVPKSSLNNGTSFQYALMIDAGSTGSRIHVYRFKFSAENDPILDDEVFEQTSPGLSSFADSPENAASSLKRLLDVAVNSVPESMHGCTPIAVKATAGLRLLGTEKSDSILQKVHDYISSNYKFKLLSKDSVVVMDGSDEGVFAWITVNYLESRIGQSSKSHTAAIMDLGGASTQIVFEPADPIAIEGNSSFALKYSKHDYALYQHSYLGYGLMQSRLKIKTSAVDSSKEGDFPCFSPNKTSQFLINNKTVDLIGSSSSQDVFGACLNFIKSQMFSKSVCTFKSCSFDGIAQPKLVTSFPSEYTIYAFSYFYDRSFPFGLTGEFKVSELKTLAQTICKDTGKYPDYPENVDLCLDLTYIYSLLSVGYEISDQRTIKVAKKINGIETGWALGATIHMIDAFKSENTQC